MSSSPSSDSLAAIKYRSEIDGLRAIAVTPVILFHAGFGSFGGGFVGVDIFFVISGFLITSIMLGEMERGTFSIARFYERRARRILPALFVVMACCIPFAWMWMIPDQLRDFGRSVVSVVFFVSNFLFWREEGSYFAAASELKPLLHTWSLAVEEQYYLFAPLTLMALWRFGRRFLLVTTLVTALVSLGLTEWGWRHDPSANFYLTPFRIWELLAGSICAFLMFGRPATPNNTLSALGLALIVFAIATFNASTPFPSLYTLVPVAGAALIIAFAHRGTYVARLLSLPPLVGIGLISYSAYLWHQPLFAFARLRSMAAPADWLMLVLAGASLVLAYLTWRFVEQPFRHGKSALPLTRRQVFATSGLAGCVFAALGLYASMSHGAPWRLPQPAPGTRDAALLASLEHHTLGLDCWIEGRTADISNRNLLCPIFTPPEPKRRILVIGDSHSIALLHAFRAVGERDAVYWMGAGSCPPLLGVSVKGSAFPIGICEQVAQREFDTAVKDRFDIVVMAARWSIYAKPPPSRVVLYPAGSAGPDPAASPAVFARSLARTVESYVAKGIKVLLVDQIPEQPAHPDKVLQQAILLGFGGDISGGHLADIIRDTSAMIEADDAQRATFGPVLNALAGDKVGVFSFAETFRDGDRLLWGDKDGSFYVDFNHISPHGNRMIEAEMAEAIRRLDGDATGG